DTLVDELWGERPPPTAGAYLQNCVSRLRKALDPARIETRVPGYTLRAEPGEIDARRFELLVARARDSAPAERAALLRDALALWRGPLLADLAYEPFVQVEAGRLDELPTEHPLAVTPPPARGRDARRTVTVLFADVTSSTALGESVDPESLRDLIGRFFGEMATTIRKHGGTVEKFAGDAVMAVF